jgi:hypothetical protein
MPPRLAARELRQLPALELSHWNASTAALLAAVAGTLARAGHRDAARIAAFVISRPGTSRASLAAVGVGTELGSTNDDLDTILVVARNALRDVETTV